MKGWRVCIDFKKASKFAKDKQSGLCLALFLQGRRPSTLLHSDLLPLFAKHPLLAELAKHHIEVWRKTGRFEGLHSTDFSSLWVSKAKLRYFLPKLCKGAYLCGVSGEPFNLLEAMRLKIKAFLKGPDSFFEAFAIKGTSSIPLSPQVIVFPEPLIILKEGQVLFFSEDLDPYFLKNLTFKEGVPIEKIKKRAEEEEFVEWEEEGSYRIEPKGFLDFRSGQLKLATLYFDYAGEKVLAFDPNASLTCSNRHMELEKALIQDLQDLEFNCMDRGSSLFIFQGKSCQEPLEMLRELGWEMGHEGKSLVFCDKDPEFSLKEEQAAFVVEGGIAFGKDLFMPVPQLLDAYANKQELMLFQGKPCLLPIKELSPYFEGIQAHAFLKEGEKVGVKKAYQSDLVAFQPFLKKSFSKTHILPDKRSGFKANLRAYQQEAVDWLLERYPGGALLADEMGLGKTLCILALLAHFPEKSSHLLLCPAGLCCHWQEECRRFFPSLKVSIFQGRLPDEKPELWIVSFSQWRLNAQAFEDLHFHCCIIDEAQFIKNSETQLFQSLWGIQALYRIALSGTPIENESGDILSLMSFLFPQERAAFGRLKDEAYIARLIQPFMLRRTKAQVLQELPEKIEHLFWVEMSSEEKQVYDKWLHRHDLNPLERLLRLRQFLALPSLIGESCGGAKFKLLCQDIQKALENGQKVLVFSQFTGVLKALEAQVEAHPCFVIQGQTPLEQRERFLQDFQEKNQAALMLMSLKVGGVGLNVTAADRVILYEPWWNEAAEMQAIDRAHRMGRKGRVEAYRYVVLDSVEEKMGELKDKKRALSKRVIDGEGKLSEEELSFLLD